MCRGFDSLQAHHFYFLGYFMFYQSGEEMAKHEFFMRAALEEAEKCFFSGDVPVGAVVVKEGKIIGRGRNRREELKSPVAHAEMNAMEEAAGFLGDWNLFGSTVYCTLEPCPMCTGAMIMSRVEKVFFGASEPKTGCCGSVMNMAGFPGFDHNVKICGGILEEKSKMLLEKFFYDLRQ